VRRVKYKPIPVRELLKLMRNLSCLMVDLAFCSVIYGDEDLAREVLELENIVDELDLLLTMQAALATRSVEDAERMVSVFRVATASNSISDAAAEIARLAISRIRLPREVALGIRGLDEVAVRVVLGAGQGKLAIRELFERAGAVVNVLAVRRGKKVVLEPSEDFVLAEGDAVIVKGSLDAVNAILSSLGLQTFSKGGENKAYGELVDMLAKLRDATTLIVDLAYAALMAKSRELAERVAELEEHVDAMYEELQELIMGMQELTSREKVGALGVVIAGETIADAARAMVEPIMAGLEPHTIIAEVLDEMFERISVIEADESDDGRTLVELDYLKRGLIVLAVRRDGKWFVRPPHSCFVVKKGDVLIIKYAAESEELVESLESEEDREEIIEDIQEEEWKE